MPRRRSARTDDARREACPARLALVVRAVPERDGARSGAHPRPPRKRHRPRQPGGRRDEPRPHRRGGGGQCDPALPRRGDAARHPGLPPRGDAPRAARARGDLVPAVDRRGGLVRSGPRRGRRRFDPAADAGHRRERALAPVFDITRDPRWGRVEETYGEDPYLAAVLGCAYVRGLQGTTSSTASPRPPSTSSGMTGRGRVQPGARARRAARAARRAAAAVRGGRSRRRHRQRHAGVLRPRRRSLSRVARAPDVDPPRRVGFDGVVASDYTAVQMLVGEHRLTTDLGTAAAMALRAGMDNEPVDRRVRRSAPAGGR